MATRGSPRVQIALEGASGHHSRVEPNEKFERFRRLVMTDPELQLELRSIPDWPTFVDAVRRGGGPARDRAHRGGRVRGSKRVRAHAGASDGFEPVAVVARRVDADPGALARASPSSSGAGWTGSRSTSPSSRRRSSGRCRRRSACSSGARRRSTRSTRSSRGWRRAGSCSTGRVAARRSSPRCSPRCRSSSFSRSRFPSTTSSARTPRRPTRSGGCARWCRRSVAADAGTSGRSCSSSTPGARSSLGTVRRAFPDVPWVFLFREPVQVLASHLRQRGAHMVPGAIDPALFGLDPGIDRADAARGVLRPRPRRDLPRRARASRRRRRSSSTTTSFPGPSYDRILGAFGLECDPRTTGTDGGGDGLRREEPAPLLRARRRREGAGRRRPPCARRPTAGCGPLYEELLAC